MKLKKKRKSVIANELRNKTLSANSAHSIIKNSFNKIEFIVSQKKKNHEAKFSSQNFSFKFSEILWMFTLDFNHETQAFSLLLIFLSKFPTFVVKRQHHSTEWLLKDSLTHYRCGVESSKYLRNQFVFHKNSLLVCFSLSIPKAFCVSHTLQRTFCKATRIWINFTSDRISPAKNRERGGGEIQNRSIFFRNRYFH